MDQGSFELVPSTKASFQPVCRACLSADLKMFDLQTKELYKDFFDLTGLQLSIGDGLQYGICYICCALLKKATSFRNKCLSSHKHLSNHVLTLEFMKKKNLLPRKSLLRTNIQTLSIINGSSYKHHIDEIKEENPSDSENHLSAINKKYDILNADSIADTNEKITDEVLLTSTTEKENSRARTLSRKAKSFSNIDMYNLDSTFNITKAKINYYTFKYADEAKTYDLSKKGDELTDSDDDLKPLSIYTNTVQNVENKTEKTKNKNVIGEENNTAILAIDKSTAKPQYIQ